MGDVEVESYNFILFLAVILLATKFLGVVSKKVNMPAVVGALLAGIILGPCLLNFISLEGETGTFLEYTAEIGVVMLMFQAGLGTEIDELKKNIVASGVTAVIGVIVPLLGGFVSYALFFHKDISDYSSMLEALFIGVVLTATSVSITVETLREMGKLKGKVGTTILGAAVIDDILGVIVLTIITSLKDPSVNPLEVCIKMLVYFAALAILAFIIRKLRPFINKRNHQRRSAIYSLVFAFVLAYASERFFGIADITGAYFAGLMLCSTKVEGYVERKVEISSYMVFSPVFFACVGLKVQITGMTADAWIFSIILLLVAILTKIAGCGLGALFCGYKKKEALQVGIGMVSRGEVALIVAQKGYQVGLLNNMLFAPIVIVVIVTTLITPILLKFAMKDKGGKRLEPVSQE